MVLLIRKMDDDNSLDIFQMTTRSTKLAKTFDKKKYWFSNIIRWM